ncbi:NAD(P)-binding domain-containing protein [Tellurirhabdus rosea]|uniref:NAD(P)-binding domain-containing protein n=1 Tax=Tellurirhabdus rosea TaxID=2674997 RepID=UPI00224F55B8|nr:NAD(P)-binding domain-containing protein [Tellurirhabdus rosea]
MISPIATLIVGAGPFGLGLASYLQRRRHDYRLVGKPLEFWERHMPRGMLLRSSANWYLDPDHEWTIERFFAQHHPDRAPAEPISREQYLAYMSWFMQQSEIGAQPHYVRHLTRNGTAFTAELENGETIRARNVVLATGFRDFACYPAGLVARLPEGRYQHTCDAVNLDLYRGKRVLLIGGRQSAFETAALLCEAEAAHVHLSYRHDTPRFVEADWSWVETIVEQMASHPAWFRELTPEQQEAYRHKLWAEGRLKLEPWLESRICRDEVTLHPRTEVASVTRKPDDSLLVTLTDEETFVVDDIILATGYQVDIKRLPFLSEALQEAVAVRNGFPLLDVHFQSTVPGLYFSSFPAGQSFGPFFGFTVAVRTAAKLIGEAVC